MKKIISLLLSLTMLLSIVSVVDFSAYADTLTTGKCGKNVTYSFDTSTGMLTISGTGDMENYNYNNYEKNPFYKKSNIKTVIIKNGVTSIGDYTFRDCTSLTSVTIPNSVTSIGYSAFYNCTSLTGATIPNSVTSIGGSAFYGCTSLTSITIPNSVTSIGSSIFYNCTSLTSIEVSGNNKNYSSLDGVLFNKNKTELITYPFGKTDSEYAIPDSVTSIGDYAFYGCTSLTSITIPNSVTSIGYYAFYNCTSLTSVTIPDSVTSIGYETFFNCTSLTSITIPDSVTSIGGSAFYGCTSLTSITIPDSVTSIGRSTFEFCRNLTSVAISDSVKNIGISAFEFCESLTSVAIPDSVTSIGASAFRCCTSLTSVTIPDGVTSIGDSAFETCTSLISINVEENNINYSSVNGVLFNRIQNELMYYPAGKNDKNYEIPDGVTSIGDYSFYGCKSLISVTIPDSVTSIGDYSFYDCTSLASIIVLSANCSFEKIFFKSNTKIYGFEKSTADKYATSNGNDFVKIYCNDYGMEHIYSKKVIKNSTCKNSGEISYTCDRCYQSYNETTPALGGEHNYEDEVITQPTCTAKGVTRYTCTRCGDSYEKENIESLGHNYEAKVVTQPTCTAKGVTRYTCSRCGDYYDKEDIAALGHNYVSKVLTQPTCTEKGITRYTCSRCGDYYDKDDIAALGHNYVSKVLTQPTCTEKGTTRYTCTRCNNYYDKKDIEELGHDTKIVERVEPTLTEDGFYRVECQRDGCGYSSSHPLEQLTLGYNQKVKSNGSDTYKIEMDKSGYLIFDFEGESKEWDINIYDEDYNKIDTLKPVYKEFYKKSYLQISLGSNVPNKNQIVALFAGKYYVEIDRLNNATNDNFSGNYTFSIDYSPANETIKETKNDFYYDTPTAKNIELNKTYNGFLGAKYACYNYVGNPILTTDERDAYKIEIPKGSGLSQFSVTLSSKAFAPLGSNCTLILYNSEFEPYDGFKPLTVSLNSTLNETIYLYEGTYYIAVVNDNSPIEYTFTTTFKPQGTFTCVEHKGKLVNTVNPTCTQNGYNSYVCQICGAQYNEIIPAYGHNAVIDYEVAPTLVSSGLTRGSHCSICGAVITPQTVIPQISAPAQPTTTPTTAAKAVSKPKSAKIKKVKAAKKAVSVEWKKVSGVKGYQVQVATDKKFKKNKKTATVKKQKTTKVTIKKLKAKKKYYVRIRTYKTVNGKKVYSSWSKVKTIKTK